MVKGVDYAEEGIKNYEEKILAQKRKTIQRLALDLNMLVSGNQDVMV